MNSLIGQCSGCCSCLGPEFAKVSRAASKSKCGFTNPDGDLNKRYLNQVISVTDGGSTSQTTGDGVNTCDASGTQVQTNVTDATSCLVTSTCSGSTSLTETDGSGGGGSASWTLRSDCSLWDGEVNGFPSAFLFSIAVMPDADCGGEDNYVTTTAYTAEYTTSALESATAAALPAWGSMPGFGSVSAIEVAFRELAGNELFFSIMESQYQFAHPISPTGHYTMTWVDRFFPDGGGSPVDSSHSYSWDGVTPSGYKDNDSSTWPTTSVFTVGAPSSNGAVVIHQVTIDCGSGPELVLP